MAKKAVYSLLVMCAITFSLSFITPKDPVPRSKAVIKTIIIDAGHGGYDRGARGDFSFEKDITLDIALRVGKKMEEEFPDVKILYTRKSDAYPAIRERADFANSQKGDLFISIHADARPPIRHSKFAGYKTEVYYTGKGKKRKKHTRRVPKYSVYYTDNPASGAATYIWAADRSDAKGDFVGERMSEEIEFNDTSEFAPDLNDPEFKAKSLLWTKRFFDKSLLLGNLVQEEFRKNGRGDLGVKQRNEKGIWVLQATAMPSILIETGFVTNRGDENYLNSKKGQEEISNSVIAAIKQYRLQTEGASTLAPKDRNTKSPILQSSSKR